MMILGSKRSGKGGRVLLWVKVHWRFFGLGSNPGEAFADVSTIFNTLCTFYFFLLLFPDGLWTTDESDELGVAGGEPVESLDEKLSKLPGALSDLT